MLDDPVSDHTIGDLAEVLDNLGVFGAHPADLAELCPTGFRRITMNGPDYYISLQAFGPSQTAYAHTHPDSEEWVVILGGTGEAFFGPTPVPLHPWSSGAAAGIPTGSVPPRNRCTCSDPAPAAGRGHDHVGRARHDHRAGRLRERRPVPPVRPVRRPQRRRPDRRLALRELQLPVLTPRTLEERLRL